MVIMDVKKEIPESPKEVTKKMCPRAARENAKNKTDNKAWKTAHTGLRFHFDRKKLVTHEFSFNSVSKTEKVTRCRSEEKSVENKSKTESTKTSDSKEIKVLMDTLKISKSEECSSSREKSPLRKEIPKSPVVERLTSKKACTRCSRCSRSPKEEKPDIKPLKIVKNHDQLPKSTKKENTKSVKVEIPQSPKICKKQCSKLAKLVEEPQEKTLKPKSILVHKDKSSRDNDNHIPKNSEINTPPLSPKATTCKKQCSKLAKLLVETQGKSLNANSNSVLTEKSASRDNEKSDASKNSERNPSSPEKPKSGKSNCENEKKVEFAWPVSVKPENIISGSDVSVTIDHPGILNGSESPVPPETVACLLNGKHDEHICDPHAGLESPDESRRELDSIKSPSKIPRKTHSAAGLKSEASLNREMMPQPLIEL